MTFKVIKINETERRIGLSFVSLKGREESERLEEYQRQAEQATHNIEEAMQSNVSQEDETE